MKRSALLVAGITLALSMAITTQAFLARGTGKIVNQIVPGKVKVTLTEPKWDPEKGEHLWPGTTVEKDPTVTNTGSMEEFVFLRLEIPVKELVLVDPETGKKTEKIMTEMVSFSQKESWIKLDESFENNNRCYVFGYKKPLKPGEQTESLFDQVTVANYLEGEMEEGSSIAIPIKAFGIQGNISDGIPDLRVVYDMYFRQK